MWLRIYDRFHIEDPKKAIVAATGIVLITALARNGLNPILGPRIPYIMFYPAVLIIAVITPRLWITGLSTLACAAFARGFYIQGKGIGLFEFERINGSFDLPDFLSFAMFILTALMCGGIGAWLEWMNHRLKQQIAENDVLVKEMQKNAEELAAVNVRLQFNQTRLTAANDDLAVANTHINNLLRELHHRVRNILMITGSMMRLEDHPDLTSLQANREGVVSRRELRDQAFKDINRVATEMDKFRQ